MRECQRMAGGADACIAFDGDISLNFCINLADGLKTFCDMKPFFCVSPEIQLPSDGCIEITDEQNSKREEGQKLNRICTCSTNGCDPSPKTGFYLILNYFLVMDNLMKFDIS